MNEEQMERNLDRINMWIDNCDQKTSFLLAFLGVVATLFLTSDLVSIIKQLLVIPFMGYWRDNIGSFDFLRFVIALCLVVGLISIFIALVRLLLCLMAKTDFSKFKQEGMIEKSGLFFGHIAQMSFSEFVEADNELLKDLQSQAYTNACICDSKFKHYNKGLQLVLFALPFLTLAFVLILFV